MDLVKCTESNRMYLYSDPSDDIQHPKNEAGAYEWWYFDALDPISGYGIVIILYDGLLFSPDYHEAVRSGKRDTADLHPGFSLSIYNAEQTVFYSLASYAPNQVAFGGVKEPVRIGNNRVVCNVLSDHIVYEIHIDEILPSGLRASGLLRFESAQMVAHSKAGNPQSNHLWNLVQPNAHVTGHIVLTYHGSNIDSCTFDTTGYHDHNIGMRALEYDFDDWYWGRIHIGDDTLVWYNMSVSGKAQTSCWLFKEADVDFAQQIPMEPVGKVSSSLFGLKRVRSWVVYIHGLKYFIVDDHVWDNGPFYQRYKVKLIDEENRVVEGANPGIAEYIKPNRISANWVKPMIKIRHHQAASKGNCIQRSINLSRHTW